MHPVLGICPVCGETLAITRLHCRACDTTIEGHFYAGRLAQLSPEQLEFVEIFLVCEGKIKAVEERLGKSYPTIRKLLREVIGALGYDVSEEEPPPPAEEERKRVLDQLQKGEITYDDALALLRG
ncbi:MAG TPA: DUF2089 domain-containing protein [Aggregatilineales bacterium]|nr:DUF2089 domain-containing protein [Anaerolineales bacterium]HRE47319.1 DUF2089 domain-containing protein [Aggregatilineales bacterium]